VSIFASYVTRTVPLPFDEPHTVTIQKLSGKALQAARQAQVTASMAFVKAMGGAAFGRELADVGAEAVAAEVDRRQADPARQYDRPTVLAKGVKAWTYSEAVTPAALDDLDDQAADFLFHAILELTLPNGDAEKKTAS
jgi:hypothetical protein